MRALYQPKGRAREYADWACNLFDGCTHGCTYCYVPAILRLARAEFHGETTLRAGVLEQLRRDAIRLHNGGVTGPVLMCFTSDPCQNPYTVEHTIEAIDIVNSAGLAVNVLTKGHYTPFVIQKLAEGRGNRFGVTLTRGGRDVEPEAGTHEFRLRALDLARRRGLRAWASIEPVLDFENGLDCIRDAADCGMGEIRVGKLNGLHPKMFIDWPAFRENAVELLERLGYRPEPNAARRYYIKRDLREAT